MMSLPDTVCAQNLPLLRGISESAEAFEAATEALAAVASSLTEDADAVRAAAAVPLDAVRETCCMHFTLSRCAH